MMFQVCLRVAIKVCGVEPAWLSTGRAEERCLPASLHWVRRFGNTIAMGCANLYRLKYSNLCCDHCNVPPIAHTNIITTVETRLYRVRDLSPWRPPSNQLRTRYNRVPTVLRVFVNF